MLCDTTDIQHDSITSLSLPLITCMNECSAPLAQCDPAGWPPIYMGVLLSDICVDYLPEKGHAKLYDEITVKTLVWYSHSVHREKWHALYDVNACENHYPGKWQAMHDVNACENYIAIILWRQSPYFKCMWNHQCIATQSPCYRRLSLEPIKPPL